MPEITYASRARRSILRLPALDAARVKAKIARLAHDPVPPDAKFLGRIDGEAFFRVRVGHYRILYLRCDSAIVIAKVDRRERAYGA